MKVETLPVADLHEDPSNVRLHPERNMAAIRASLARFGQQRPILVDAKGVVRAGNGTLAAARELGWETINVVRTPLEGSEATAYAIADNRTAEIAEWDDAALAATLRSLQSEDFDLAAMGYDDAEVDALCAGLADEIAGTVVDDPAGEWQGMPEFEHEDLTAIQSIHVHFKTREDVAAFAVLVGQPISDKTRSLWYPQAEIGRYADKQYTDEPALPDLHHQ